MGKHNMMESLSLLLQVIQKMARPEGVTVTELAREMGLDRWTMKSLIDSLEAFNANGSVLCVDEDKDPNDHRRTIYRISPDSLWNLQLPSLGLSEEESFLFALMMDLSRQVPVLKDAAEGLWKKVNWVRNPSCACMVHNALSVEKILPPSAKPALEAILAAIRKNQCLAFDYVNAGNTKQGRREVLPLYLFFYDGGIYLNAQKVEDGALRTYALERIMDVPQVLEVANPPEKLPYDGRLEDPFGPFWEEKEYAFTVRFDSWQGWYRMQQQWPKSVTITKLPDGEVLFTGRTRCLYGAKEWIRKESNHCTLVSSDWPPEETWH